MDLVEISTCFNILHLLVNPAAAKPASAVLYRFTTTFPLMIRSCV